MKSLFSKFERICINDESNKHWFRIIFTNIISNKPGFRMIFTNTRSNKPEFRRVFTNTRYNKGWLGKKNEILPNHQSKTPLNFKISNSTKLSIQ